MITSVGKFLRKLRIDNGEILADMAVKLDVTVSFLSAVENGKKKLPSSWYSEICQLYHLNEAQEELFAQAIGEAEKVYDINFDGVEAPNRELAVSFARKFAQLDEEQLEAIRKILRGV